MSETADRIFRHLQRHGAARLPAILRQLDIAPRHGREAAEKLARENKVEIRACEGCWWLALPTRDEGDDSDPFMNRFRAIFSGRTAAKE